jgi:hypothetical protein
MPDIDLASGRSVAASKRVARPSGWGSGRDTENRLYGP